jgi:hypothetical protein
LRLVWAISGDPVSKKGVERGRRGGTKRREEGR